MDKLKKFIEEYGMSGMKLWIATFCDDPCVFPLIEKCIEYGMPILLHAFYKATGQMVNESTGLNVAALARRYPQAKFIMMHLGGNCYHCVKAVREHTNVVTDISESMFRRDDVEYNVR